MRQLFAKVGHQSADSQIDLAITHANTNLTGNGVTPQSMLDQNRSSVYTVPDNTRNQMTMLNLTGSYWLSDKFLLSGLVYHRYNKQPIEIGRLQRHAMDAFFRDGSALAQKAPEQRAGRVACIGAGPASLALAAELRQRGFAVTIFERKPLPGGLNTYGVAEYKLRSSDSLREIEVIRALGVDFRFGAEIGGEAAFAQLEREYDFVFLGIGLGAMHTLKIPGEHLPGVIDALKFIEGYKTGGKLAVGRRVAVVGAGNTAIDAARAAVRLGAAEEPAPMRASLGLPDAPCGSSGAK